MRKGRSHAIKAGREGCLESQRSLCQSVVQTVPGSSGVAGDRLFQLPVAGPGSLWSKSDAETEVVPRDDAESEKRPSAKSPPSPHPISKPPATAEDTPSNREPGHPTGHLQCILRSELADSGQRQSSQQPPANPIPTWPPGPATGTPAPAGLPPVPARPHIRQTPPSAGIHHHLRKEIKTLPSRGPRINVPAVKTNVASSHQHLFLINAVTLP